MPQRRVTLEEDILLLVEGRDEVGLFNGLIKNCLQGNKSQIQVLDAGGKEKFKDNIETIRTLALKRPTLRSIGIIRDADSNAESSFISVCNSLRAVGYKPPAAHAEFSDATPSIGVFIVPDGSQSGAIETLCRRSVQGEAAAECVDEYMECLTTNDALQSKNPDKTFAHAYLAAMEDPVARVGEGALQGVWDLQSPAFDALSQFVHNLVS